MAQRSTETSMDFEYNNGIGPVDAASPWLSRSRNNAGSVQPQTLNNPERKRTHDVFNSPSKPSGITLRDPAPSRTFLFSQPSRSTSPTKSLPPRPILNNPAFNTPRSNLETNYDSSEVDASSPDYNADSDATPDQNMGMRSAAARATKALVRTLTPEKKNPALARLNHTSGRGEIAKTCYSHNADHRIRKKRSKFGVMSLARRKDSSSDDEKSGKLSSAAQGPGAIASFFSFIHMHPDLPHILSYYAQFLLNSFIVTCIVYLVYCFWTTIRSDVDKKAAEAVKVIMAEMAACSQEFEKNRCARDTRAPALEAVCNNWEVCMSRDPYKLSRAQVSAHTFAEIFNSFIEPISWKAMIFTIMIVCGSFYFSNLAFNQIRKQQPQQPFYIPTPAATPQRHPGGPQEYHYGAFQSPTPRYPEPAMAEGLGMGSPTRRLQY